MDCPSNAIELIVVDKDSKRFVMRYHVDRCTFCAQCVQSCQFKCLGMSKDEWELASLSKEPFTVYYGNDPEVESVLARFPRQDAETVTPPESSA
jgi:formate hydrogenlyase subunit 6/NADH:ubiquinone oxidoreductase subunit I